MVSEYSRTQPVRCTFNRPSQMPAKAVSEKDVIAKHKRARLSVDELTTNHKRLSEAIWLRLLGVFKADTKLRSIPQKPFEIWEVMGS